jgi:aspartyl aminopeptidase
VSKRTKAGYLQVGVELYGGGIWHSWLDRDLSLAGRVVVKNKNGSFNSTLVKIERPLLHIPTLAIHCEFLFVFIFISFASFGLLS